VRSFRGLGGALRWTHLSHPITAQMALLSDAATSAGHASSARLVR
jgi:hypothetical protein